MSSEEPPDIVPFPAFEESEQQVVEAPKTPDHFNPFSGSNPSSGEQFDTTVTPRRDDLFLPDTSSQGRRRRQQQQELNSSTPDRSLSTNRGTYNPGRTSPGNRYSSQNSGQSPKIYNRRSPRHHHHHHNSSSSPSKTTVRECICGRGVACIGMTQAFRLLGDPRAYYVELPRYRKDPTAYKYVFRNNLRQAYLRHLVRQNPEHVRMDDFTAEKESAKRRYVALHHFHPAVVRAFYENPLTSAQKHKVPISITEHELEELGMDIFQEDQILSVSGMPTGGYYFVPSYPHERAHDDLKTLIHAVRSSRLKTPQEVLVTTSNSDNDKHDSSRRRKKEAVPTDIQISQKNSPTSETKRKIVMDETPGHSTSAVESLRITTTTTTTTMEEPLFADESFKDNVFTSFKTEETVEKPTDESFGDHAFDAFQIKGSESVDAFSDDVFASFREQEPKKDTILVEPTITAVDVPETETIGERTDDIAAEKEADFDPFPSIDTGDDDGLTSTTDDFDNLWETDTGREIETNLFNQTIFEEEDEGGADDGEVEDSTPENDPIVTPPKTTTSLAARRSSDRNRPWETPKYRRDRTTDEPRMSSGPADYIDPSFSGDLSAKLSKSASLEDDGDDIARIAADLTVFRPQEQSKETKVAISPSPSLDSHFSKSIGTTSMGSTSPKPKRRFDFAEKDAFSMDSGDSGMSGAIFLNHQLPGADPTLRIQVHNDLIAWESKRRSDLAHQLEYNRERWEAALDILRDGIAEVQYAERLILGISKASKLFADSLRAVYDDKLLDDQGNAVKNSFLQNRLARQRSKFEYSIENEDTAAQSKQSMLLDSIVEAQLDIANSFVDNTTHMEEEILPEIAELTADTARESRKLELLGESILGELKRSELEVKNIWDVFDAMVTGDLMEYTVHGSTHGGSSHGGSFHGGSFHSPSMSGASGSIHGFLTPSGDNEAPIVSSVHSPLVKTTFRQLGGVEDGWLIEMYYKSAVEYQRSVFGAADMEFRNLLMEITTLEEKRFRKLHQLMLAFAPRQRRLFNQLPDHLKAVLENLVGLRIDEESLQKIVDESVRDRSRDHLKGSTAHKSSILNRSRVNAQPDTAENEVEEMESKFGSPFASPLILLSKLVELKPTGLKSLVNTAWKPALAVVTSEGNILVFELSDVAKTPSEAFKSLYPPMNFEDPNIWIAGRKAEIVKALTPTISLKLVRSTLLLPPMRKSQVEIIEEKEQMAPGGTAKSRFMNAVKSTTTQQNKCTLRVPTATEANEWANLLERTKKVLLSQAGGRGSRFRF
ncbi:hypothetical protein IV203_000325 [Nitzschia inconspicua]|uniref:PH domain-containing protein n=1 Tax=Nitzschia inconspicua TaxID=303405 RepID=A0A9K3L4P0_9STRA|nr:hypothetical protein IV203_000325 [Nitzschia inconspicua]